MRAFHLVTPHRPVALGHVVGLGASAGGLQPLSDFLGACPRGQGLALIVVQHMARAHVSALATLLGQHGDFRVLEAADGMVIEADHAYVITPATRLSVAEGRLRVAPAGRLNPSPDQIDTLFESMASAWGPRAVGVVMSGMGSDGMAGLRAIVVGGGIALVQTLEAAQFDTMPRSAASIGSAVLIDQPALMPARILAAIAARTSLPAPLPAPAMRLGDEAGEAEALAAVLAQVTAVTGHDFSPYKTSTLKRRIARRQAIHDATDMAAYARLLKENRQETELLFRELLIGVTRFFRDPALWDAVAEQVLPGLLERATVRSEPKLRAWVVGCSTGEEAYTLAMLLREAIDAHPGWPPGAVQIFASDLSEDAIQTARRGVYPASIADDVSPQRLARFFVREGGGYRVAKALRQMVLFARHDVISDAPFTRIDLVSCRNLLIYFRTALQQQVLPLFHYVLQPGGCLLLGNSETTGRFDTMFPAIDAKLRIHRRAEVRRPGKPPFSLRRVSSPALPLPIPDKTTMVQPGTGTSPPPPLQGLADRLMLDEVSPPAVLVSASGDILYISGRTGRFLEPAAGKANWNIHAMAREGLRAGIAAALREARAEGRPAELHGLAMVVEGLEATVDLSVRPVQWSGHEELALIVFRESAAAAAPPAGAKRPRRSAVKSELGRALEEVQALREEMRSSQEELQSANEEMQSTNEELQSTNEELTTSKEEMQAMNEELQTVNAELLSKLGDLALAQSDLKNLLNSTQIATLFLDGAQNVRRFTEQAKRVINLRDSDIGRPLSDLTMALDYPDLTADVEQVLRTLEFREREVPSHDARWYSVRIMPYRTQDNVIDGSVITFADITAAKELEARLRVPGSDQA